MTGTGAAPALVEGVGLHKSFPGVHALRGVDLRVERGQVHALVGENGAGKSTLVKVFSGVHAHDAGRLLVEGREVTGWDARHALASGISTIYQEFNLVPDLTVMENVFLGREPTRRGRWLRDRRELRRRTAELLARLDVDVAPDAQVSRLGIAQRQAIEIAKALSLGGERVLILDEPTATLSPRESEQLFAVLRRLTREGVGILYISHRLDEVRVIADVVTVLRDGIVTGTLPAAQADHRTLIRLMVGRELGDFFTRNHSRSIGEPALRVRGLATERVAHAELEVRAGEVVGLFGLIGAGRTELLRAIVGADRVLEGTVEVKGRPVTVRSPSRAVRLGLGLAPEDRKGAGIIPDRSVRENLVLAALPKLARRGLIRRRRLDEVSQRYVDRLRIRTPALSTRIANLSGGSQQKVILARLLAADADVLLLDEPTRGIDVGAKKEVYDLLGALAAGGKAILAVSSDLEEVLGLSDRIVVMRKGRTVGELPAAEATREAVLDLAFPEPTAAGV